MSREDLMSYEEARKHSEWHKERQRIAAIKYTWRLILRRLVVPLIILGFFITGIGFSPGPGTMCVLTLISVLSIAFIFLLTEDW